MKPRPLLRSITFWCGILVMGFICWAWRDSQRASSFVSWSSGEVRLLEGSLGLQYSPGLQVPKTPRGRAEIVRGDQEFRSFPFPRPRFARGGEPSSASDPIDGEPPEPTLQDAILLGMSFRPASWWVLFIPFWMILLAVALPWVGLLLWRARRIRRASGLNSVVFHDRAG